MEVIVVVVFFVLLQTEVTNAECEGCTYGCCRTDRGDEECCTAIVPVFGVIAAVMSCGVVIAIVAIVCCCRRQRPDVSKKGSQPSPDGPASRTALGTASQRYPLMPLRDCDGRVTHSSPWTDIEGRDSWSMGIAPGHTLVPTPTGSTYSIRTSTVVDLPSYQQNFSVF
ncbi:uncharacterized protein LOC117330856 [Pecten maximus]|uniref:uncharacterized protein LOC117330856 n=1 Tax=Pecten maximus TaxID=6579 RepID=UPI001458F71D|nr:uncharacterized protein LOC117330856 [Pecten maximus]